MKYKESITSVFVVLLFSTFIPSVSHTKNSILDYYNSIPVNLLNDDSLPFRVRYPLQFKNNAWVTRSAANYEIEVIVDINNGYLKIFDGGTGGTRVHELALFRTHEAKDIIGMNLIGNDGHGVLCRLRFYKPVNGRWIDVTNDVLPKVDISYFVSENHTLNARKLGASLEGIAFVYQLPRVGPAMHVTMDLDRLNKMREMTQDSREILRHIKYQAIQLKWDNEMNRFRVGKKTPIQRGCGKYTPLTIKPNGRP